MTWSWRYENAEGKQITGPTETFSSQADAESWLGQNWRDLLGGGSHKVTLLEEDRVEYTMSLETP